MGRVSRSTSDKKNTAKGRVAQGTDAKGRVDSKGKVGLGTKGRVGPGTDAKPQGRVGPGTD